MMSATAREGMEELMALSVPPLKNVCAFKSMTSFGSHYRVELEEAGGSHVTFDVGVAEVAAHTSPPDSSENATRVELVRVGVLEDIWVLNYGNLNIVLMVVSWVAKHTEMQPRIRRDTHGFWLANMAARPRDTTNPYILPTLASQVHPICERQCLLCVLVLGRDAPDEHADTHLQVFFVDDKSMPGWCVILKKEARGRRMTPADMELNLGQEESSGDQHALTEMGTQGGEAVGTSLGYEPQAHEHNARRRTRY